MNSTEPAGILALATANPDNHISQDEVVKYADAVFMDQYREYRQLRPVFVNSGIKKRHMAMPLEWYLEAKDFQSRTDAFLDSATDLFVKATQAVLDEAELKASEIDIAVTVSSTGIATPALDARAAGRLGFRTDLLRVPVFGLGCAGGVAGLSIANQFARSNPAAKILFVALELCTLSIRLDQFTKANLVATALFGDGAAAAIISTKSPRSNPVIGMSMQHTWPDTLNIMGWKVDPVGFEVVFDRAIPNYASRYLHPVVYEFLAAQNIAPSDLSRLSFHPGGKKVIEALESAFGLNDGTLDIEREVLVEFGNMSSPTALFVLRESIERGLSGKSLLSALGPGFTAASTLLDVHQ